MSRTSPGKDTGCATHSRRTSRGRCRPRLRRCCAIAMATSQPLQAKEKQGPLRVDLLEVLDVAQRQRLDQVLVAIADVIERTKRVNRLLGSYGLSEVCELIFGID